MITLARVDLPEPFGPISAWVSPCRTTRSMPFRISLSSTFACRPRISRVAPPFSLISHLDQDVVAVDDDAEGLDRLRRRQAPRPPRAQVEGRAVLRALDRAEIGVDLSLVQVVVLVRADRVHGAE